MNLIVQALRLILIWKVILQISAIGKHYDGLVKYLKEESKLHRVVFLFNNDKNNTDDSVSFLVKSINRNFPSSSIEYNKRRRKMIKVYLKSLEPPRTTTLFVVVTDRLNYVTTKWVKKSLSTIKMLSKTLPTPKCLIVHSRKIPGMNIRKTLEDLWQNDFLDVTILVHQQEDLKQINKSRDYLPAMHRLNPFTSKYTVLRLLSAKSKWFPNKLDNLHGYPLKFLYSNSNWSMATKFSTAKKFTEILAREMNFKPEIYNSPSSIMRKFTILHKERAEMFANTFFLIGGVDMNTLKLSYFIRSDARAVIPKIAKFSNVIVFSQEFLFMILATVSMICVLELTAVMMRFRESTWTTLNISQIIMGMSITEEPVKLVERMVFGSLLLACLVYTGYFFSVILDVSLQSPPEITTLAELAASSLQPVVNNIYINYSMAHSSNPHIVKLAQNSIVLPDNKSELGCLLYLNDYQNVSCISSNTILHVNRVRQLRKEFNGKLLLESVARVHEGFVLRYYSPFTDRFRKIILKVAEHGFILKLFRSATLENQILERPEGIEKEKLLLISLYVLSIGFSLSLLIFLFEILSSIFDESIFDFLRRFV